LAAASLVSVFKAERVTDAGPSMFEPASPNDQKTVAPSQQRRVSGGMTGCVNDLQPAREWQCLAVVDVLVDANG
jgi:hypothetical protein